ncbi:MAG: KAP family P-loop NTPase fold protein [Blastocatellia bacterium]
MIFNDEPTHDDELGHNTLVRRVGHRALKCNPPYVVGVCGSWGAGKTSFLHKLWAYLGGEFEIADQKRKRSPIDSGERFSWFQEAPKDFNDLLDNRKTELIWFNPWQHQFESNPMVALLSEIRRQFSLRRKLFDEAGKLTDVAIHSTLNALAEMGKELKIPLPSAKSIMERGREYEAEHFSTALSSQRFRDFFESAIEEITKDRKDKKKGLLVIFIDDLDRCEGDVAYRLLEALKLYLNARNCVYVLGLDQQHLESSIAKVLSGEKETWRYHPLARDYLSKMFQGLFLLPVPRDTEVFVNKTLDPQDEDFRSRLEKLFGFTDGAWPELVAALDQNLPHNPRKIKSFISSWKLYLDLLPDPPGEDSKLDWRLTLILHYLAQFEEPIFRKVEESPIFYTDHVQAFALRGFSAHPLFYGLELPYEIMKSSSGRRNAGGQAYETGGLDTVSDVAAALDPARSALKESDEIKPLPEPRIFWISRLIRRLVEETASREIRTEPEIPADFTLRHLPHTGGKNAAERKT